MRRIAILTSGGDAPGMNAAIRAVARTAHDLGMEAFGVNRGFQGLVECDVRPLGPRDVGGIIQLGGTMLGSARCPQFKEIEIREQALEGLKSWDIDGLVVIGGNGSQTGSTALHDMGFPVVGVASTIDNDLAGSDITIGVDTALAVALEAIDRLKTTASSHRRAFLVEVMGRDCGYLALAAGVAGGAEAVIVPEKEVHPEDVAKALLDAWRRGKPHALVVVAEGARPGARAIADFVAENRQELGFGVRVTTLGHVQRGGAPGPFDRLLGSRLGSAAAQCLHRGETGVLVGLIDGHVSTTPLHDIVGKQKPLDPAFVDMVQVLAR